MIPLDKREAVTRGLREAFGVTQFDDIATITGGQTSSLVFRLVVQGSPYLLKIIMRAENPARHYANLKVAAEGGVAPAVHYTDVEAKISITGFVAAERLPASEALVRLPALLRTLHALPPFGPAPFNTTSTFLINSGPALDGFLDRIRASNILPEAERAEFFARYAEVSAVYPCDDGEMVASHNDLFKPDNILFDGRRVWLVDWEAAFLNDRYADLAVVANQIVTTDADERLFLHEYFGAAPDQYQLARFHLMQQLAHIFYTMAFLLLRSSERPIDWSEPVPDVRAYYKRLWAGELDLADPDVRIMYGRVHLEQLLQNVRQARYRQALEIVADVHAAR